MTMLASQALAENPRRLEPCPASPNCISSQAKVEDKEHYLPPFSYTMSEEALMAVVEDILLSRPRTKLMEKEVYYRHITFTSRIFRFVDDVEILLDPDSKMLHFRSAARVGRGDMGVNRRRMLEFIKELELKAF